MIVHLDKEQAKQERRRLLGACSGTSDIVYITFHDALKAWQKEGKTKMTPVELFLSAKNMAIVLMRMLDATEGIEDEIEDLEDEAEGENDAMVIMMLASCVLSAASRYKVNFDSKSIILAIYGHYNDHPLFLPFIEYGCKKEEARWIEGKRANLMKYELEIIENTEDGQEEVKKFIMSLGETLDSIDVESIKNFLLVLYKHNTENGNKYNDEIIALYKKYSEKVNKYSTNVGANNGIVAGGNFNTNINLNDEQLQLLFSNILSQKLISNNNC